MTPCNNIETNGLEWLFEAFMTSPPDRARFLAIILSAILVFIGVWYTQWQTNRRERKSFYREKLAETYEEVLNTESMVSKLFLQSFHKDWDELVKDEELELKTVKQLKKIEVLLRLNFPKQFKKKEYYDLPKSIFELLRKMENREKNEHETYLAREEYRKAKGFFSKIQTKLENLAEKC